MPFLKYVRRSVPLRVVAFRGTARLARLAAAAALAGSAGTGCSSSSGTSMTVFVPGFDAGFTAGPDGSVRPVDGGQVTPTPESGTPPADSATDAGDAGQPPPIGNDGGTVVVPSSGIVITVIPDGTGDARGLLTAIQNATKSVHVEMYLLSNAAYIDALINLKKTGLDVKVILNQTFPTGTTSSDTNASSYAALSSGGVPVVWSPTTTGFDNFTHEKAVIIDSGATGEQVWVMTMNLDTDAPKYNREYLAQDTNAADIAEAETIFEADYAATEITPSGNLVVAPSPQNNAASVLLSLVTGATTTIDMEAEEIDESGTDTETKIFDALTAKAKAGVAVRLVLEDSTESTQATAVAGLQAAGGQVKGYAYAGSTGLDIHAKALVADGARAYVGSENFTGGSLGYNRELGVYFTTASEVSKVDSTILTDFANGSTYSSQ